jgi:ribosomal protein S27AE
MAQQRYARLRADVDAKVRRGAWYKVLATDGLNVTLQVNKRSVILLKALLEVVDRPPPKWTVVETPAKGRAKLGERYGVCPSCGERTPLAKKVKRLQCANCKWEFEVAWGESYLPR